jgi:hypothetical protein
MKMRRLNCVRILVAVAVVASAVSLAQAQNQGDVYEFSQGTNPTVWNLSGQLQLGGGSIVTDAYGNVLSATPDMSTSNVGMIFDDPDATVSGSVPFTYNPGGTGAITGTQGIIQALADGMNYANGTTWAGTIYGSTVSGIISPLAASNIGEYTVGYVSNDGPTAGYATWHGVNLKPIGSNQVLVANTYAGDIDMDGSVTSTDAYIWLAYYSYDQWTGGWVVPGGNAVGDINGDGYVNADDMYLWLGNYGLTMYTSTYSDDLATAAVVALAPPAPAGSLNAVPEPGALALLVAGGVAIFAVRFVRRRQK